MNVYGSPIAIKVSVTEANKPFSSLIKYCKESQDNNLKHKQNSILSYNYHNFFKLIIFLIVCLETKIIKGSYTFKLFQRLGTRAIYEELLHSFTHLFQPTNTHKLSNGMKFTLIVNLWSCKSTWSNLFWIEMPLIVSGTKTYDSEFKQGVRAPANGLKQTLSLIPQYNLQINLVQKVLWSQPTQTLFNLEGKRGCKQTEEVWPLMFALNGVPPPPQFIRP